MILILSNKFDITTDFVIKELQKKDYPYVRINTEDLHELKVSTSILNDEMLIETNDGVFDFVNDIGIVWNRRPRDVLEFSDSDVDLDQGTLEFVRDQWSEWLVSLESVSGITWVNAPEDNRRMESKITQLRLAHNLGFTIPETVVTNDASKLSGGFSTQNEDIVAKSLGEPLIKSEEQNKFIYTVELDEVPSHKNENIGLCPTIFQKSMTPKTDYRVTVIGNSVYPVKIIGTDKKDVPLDWRTELDDIQFVQSDLPQHITDLCRNYVERANLKFGAIDLVEVDDEFIFLEINPNGEWGWLQKPWDVPIAETLTEYLIENDTRTEYE